MSNNPIGTLVMNVKTGESLTIGASKIFFKNSNHKVVEVVIEAPKTINIKRIKNDKSIADLIRESVAKTPEAILEASKTVPHFEDKKDSSNSGTRER